MEPNLIKMLSEQGDVLLKINKPGTGQVRKIQDQLVEYGFAFEVFNFVTPHSDDFKANAEKYSSYGDKLAILDFNMPLNEVNLNDMKKTIEQAQSLGLQLIIAVQTPNNDLRASNSDIEFYSSSKDLLNALENHVNNNVNNEETLVSKISSVISSIRDKATHVEETIDKPKLK